MSARAAWVGAAMLAVAPLAACGGDDPAARPAIVTQEEPGAIPGARLEIEGTLLRTDALCLVLVRDQGEAPWIVWPAGAVAENVGVALAGEHFAPGDRVRGVGVLAVLADIPGGNHDDTYYGEPGHACDGDAAGVVAFDNLAHVGS